VQKKEEKKRCVRVAYKDELKVLYGGLTRRLPEPVDGTKSILGLTRKVLFGTIRSVHRVELPLVVELKSQRK